MMTVILFAGPSFWSSPGYPVDRLAESIAETCDKLQPLLTLTGAWPGSDEAPNWQVGVNVISLTRTCH